MKVLLILASLAFFSFPALAEDCEEVGMVEFKIDVRDTQTKIYFNGGLTKLTGHFRLFTSHDLKVCKVYYYEIAIVSRYVNRVFTVPARAGESYYFSF